MRDYIEIGSTPCDEDCAQVGSDNYSERAIAECRRYIDLLIKTFGKPPARCDLKIKSNPHDFGSYYEVACYFETEAGAEYAYNIDANVPYTWNG